jgi:hypothetical protein
MKSKYFIHMYENRIMKPVKNFQRRGKGIKKSNRVVNSIKVHYMHVWKYHNETPLYNEYMLIKKMNNNRTLSHLNYPFTF